MTPSGLARAAVLLVLGLSASRAAPAGCVRPDPDALLESLRQRIGYAGKFFPSPQAIYAPPPSNDRAHRWVGLSWWGPRNGVLVVLNCAGKPVATEHTGFIRRLKPGPQLARVGPTVETIDFLGEVTGSEDDDVGLFALRGGLIRRVWTHAAFHSEYVPWIEPPFSTLDTWAYAASARTISVAEFRYAEPLDFPDPFPATEPNTRADRRDTFCWRASAWRYLPCAGAPFRHR